MGGKRWLEYLKEGSWELNVVYKVTIHILIMYTVFSKTSDTPKDHQKSSDILA